MSSVVSTVTPFINRAILLNALDAVGCKYRIRRNEIITDRHDRLGEQKFIFSSERYIFVHEDYTPNYSWGSISMQRYSSTSSFLSAVAKEYNRIYAKKLEELERKRLSAIAEEERKKAEEEKERLERERKDLAEKLRAAIVTNAKEKGYDVLQETKVDNKVKLVLVRTVY
jgi:uncharacterized protein (UPF0335 family)